MEAKTQSQTIELEVLTPIHIGTGQKMAPNAGFVAFPQEKRVAVLDEEKVLDVVGVDQIQAWVGLIHKRQDLLPWLQQRRPGIKAAEVARRTLHTPGPLGTTSEFRPMMHTGVAGELPYVPGSSVKGAVRTALFAEAVRGEAGNQHLYQFPQEIGRPWSADGMNKSVFSARAPNPGKAPNYDYLRLLHIGDAHFARDSTWCLPHEIHRLTGDVAFEFKPKPNRNNPMRVLLEVLPVGATSTVTWQLASLLNAADIRTARQAEQARVLNPPPALTDFGALLQTLNAHTQRLIEHELQQLPARKNFGYLEELQKLLHTAAACLPGREAVLRVGFGSGHTFMTGGWMNKLTPSQQTAVSKAARTQKTQERFPFPKSRKLVPGAEGGAVAVPLGFLKLTLLTAQEAVVREQARQASEAKVRQHAEAAAEEQAIEQAKQALKARTGEYLPNRVKGGNEFEAVVIAFAGIQLTLKVLIGPVAMPPQAQHEQPVTLRYPSGLPIGAVVRVSIGQEQKGKIQSVMLKSIKFDPSKTS